MNDDDTKELREMIRHLQREHAKQLEPFIKRLVEIESMHPPKTYYLTPSELAIMNESWRAHIKTTGGG
jgi:hypothetical protein